MKRYILLICSLLIATPSLFAEGIEEIRPFAAAKGELNPWDWGGEFASYNAPADRQLKVHVANHSVEQVYLGFNSLYSGTTYMRIRNPLGVVVYGPVELKKFGANRGWIPSYNAAVAGPNKISASGYIPFTFNPTMNGDYTIELNPDDPNTKVIRNVRYDLFDITVVDTVAMQEKKGRLWAKLWAMTTAAPTFQFWANFYVLREDSVRYKVDYNGIFPHGFGIVSNSRGITNTNDAEYDRQSRAFQFTQGTVVYYPEHKLFINPPDSMVYPYARSNPQADVPTVASEFITGCISTGYCINLTTTTSGYITVILDFDGIIGYNSGGPDRTITFVASPGQNCVPWDGYDGLGDTARTGIINIQLEYQPSVIHIPIWDAENHPNGYKFFHLGRGGVETQVPLYWDDRPIGLGANFLGCLDPVNADSCRAWSNGNGNERFMNTWTSFRTEYDTLVNFTFQFCAPEAIDDLLTINQAETDSIDPLANDPFLPGQVDISTLTLTVPPLHGTSTWLPALGLVEYVPDPTYVGLDSVQYQVCDTSGLPICVAAWIRINVQDVNLPPIIDSINGVPPTVYPTPNPEMSTNEDVPLSICVDITDFDQDLILFSVVRPAQNGNLSGLNDGDSCFLYTPDPNFFGRDTIVIQVCDNGIPTQCSQAIIPIRVIQRNDAPVITQVDNIPVINDTVNTSTLEDQTKVMCYVVQDPDIGQTGAVTSLISSIPGTLMQIDPVTGCINYQPAQDYSGLDTVRMIYCDNGAPSLCDTVFIIINIIPVNDAPIAIDDQGTVDPGDTICINVTLNDIDAENALTSISIVGQPSLGSAYVNGLQICYIANPAIISGIDTIRYRVCDAGFPVRCDTGIVRIFIPAGPYPPTANDDAYVINEDAFISMPVMNNDLDANGDPLVLTIKTQPVNGTATISANSKNINYTPGSNYCGLDSLEYEIFDITGLSGTAWVHITVVCVPDNPIVLDPFGNSTSFLTFTVLEDDTSQICLDFRDADGDAVDVTQAIPIILNGQISGLSDGDSCFTYIPTPNFTGSNDLNFIYCDNGLPSRCDTVNITIQVIPVNDAPMVMNDLDSTTDGSQISIPVLANDSDIDGSLVHSSVQIVSPPANGNAIVNSITGVINYTAPTGFSGIDTLVYQVCDNGTPLPGKCAQASVFIYVEQKSFTINSAIAICDNDIAKIQWDLVPDNFTPTGVNPLTITWLDTAGSVIQVNSNLPLVGELNWPGMIVNGLGQPIDWPGWVFSNGVWTQAADGFEGLRPQATVVFQINPSDTLVLNYPPANTNCSANPSLPPLAVNDTASVPNDSPSNIDVLANDNSPDNRPISISNILFVPQNGQAAVVNGQIQYTPNTGSCGNDSLQYEVCDDRIPAQCSSAWVYLEVSPVDSDNDGLNDIYETFTRNSDTDVLRDYLDPDSDNDGMSDEFESRRTGDDCLFNTLEFDGDLVPDWRDPDSDNDGIPDYVERATVVRAPTGNDINANGIDDAYDVAFGGYLENDPVDTDGDGLQDYHDIDSDGDGIPDCIEGYAGSVCPSGSDTDGDGIDDAFDPDNGGSWGGTPVDTDNDGIPDFRDPDSDNDGNMDGPDDPGDRDCNGNGIPDFRDPLACSVVVPGGMSPGTDGANDVLVIENLDNFPNNRLQIFSRWGLIVYDSGNRGYEQDWDGTINVGAKKGEKLPTGVYYYVLNLDRTDPDSDPITGNIMLINREE